ncbi:MAG TPA: ATP-binding protein [Sulfurospirillum sp. UBA11407]|jgi:signal transduction histidine kinase|nr:MAG TPA: ATP-binding protein [Sulfurospirillum sp. UBA11407]
MLLQISEALDIGLKSSDKKAIIYLAINIFLLVTISVLLIFIIDSHIENIYFRVFIYHIVLIAFMLLSYIIAEHFLSPMLETKRMLNLLLKDTLHELNIPLSVIAANLQMLRKGELDVKKQKRFQRIELACEDLKRLYQDLDYYIKREVRRDLKEVFELKNVLEQELEKLNSHNPQISLHVQEGITLFADKRGFIKVIDNLISNAIKYNKDNNAIIIKYTNKRLSVVDRGIGISETELFKVFDRYYQLDATKDGFGIGLSIVKAYCDEQKIFLNIASKLGIGTTVSLDLKNVIYNKAEV